MPRASKEKLPPRAGHDALEKLASLPDAHTFVRPGTTLAHLQAKATRLVRCD